MYPAEYSANVRGRYYWELVFSYDNSESGTKITEQHELQTKKQVSSRLLIRNKFNRSSDYRMDSKSNLSLKFSKVVDIGGSIDRSTSTHLLASSELERSTETGQTIEEIQTVRRTYEIPPGSKFELYRLCYEMDGVLFQTEVVSNQPKEDDFVDLAFTLTVSILGLKELLLVLVNIVPGRDNKKAWRNIRGTIVSNFDKSEETAFKALVTQMSITDPQQKKRLWASVRTTCAEILRDWDSVDKNNLFGKLIVRLATTRPANEQKNKVEWERIRSTCNSLLDRIVLSTSALVDNEVTLKEAGLLEVSALPEQPMEST